MIPPKDPELLANWDQLYETWQAAAALVHAAEHSMDAITRASLFHQGIGPTIKMQGELNALRSTELLARLKVDEFVYTRLVKPSS